MEKNKPFESSINRQTPEIPIGLVIDGERQAFLLRYDNTLIVTHHEDYAQFDHVMLYEEYPLPIYMYRDDDGSFELAERLMHEGFDSYDKTYPSIDDEQRYYDYQSEKLDEELREL